MLLLRVSYRVRAHHIGSFEEIFLNEIEPLIREYGLNFLGIWKSRVGQVGEFLELWQFEDMADFDQNWKSLIEDPRLQQTFVKTGPMVEDESFSLFEPVSGASAPARISDRFKV